MVSGEQQVWGESEMSTLRRPARTPSVQEVGLQERECLYGDGIEVLEIESWLDEEA